MKQMYSYHENDHTNREFTLGELNRPEAFGSNRETPTVVWLQVQIEKTWNAYVTYVHRIVSSEY